MSGESFEKDKAFVSREFGNRINRLLPLNMGPGTPVRQLLTSIVKAYPSDIKASDDDRVNQAIQALFGKRIRQRRSDAIDDSAGIRRMEELYASDCLFSGTKAPRSIETLASIVASELASDDDNVDRTARRLRLKFDALEVDISKRVRSWT
jgi:hypothetical protein